MPLITIKKRLKNWIADGYGSRRGFILTYGYRVLSIMGRYRAYKKVDLDNIGRLVFVCKGNICRSAFAEAVASSLGIESISCGIATKDGGPADDGAIRTAEMIGIDLRNHNTQTLESLTFKENDFIIAMEPAQADFVKRKLKNVTNFSLLGLWGNPRSPYIQDPYGATSAYYEKCFDYIEKSVHRIAMKIR